MKKTILILSLALAFVGAQAQQGKQQCKSPTQQAEMLTEEMDKVLNLTPDQEDAIHELNLKHAKFRAEVKGKRDDGASNEDLKKEARAQKTARKEALSEILTEEQMSTWKTHRNELRTEHKRKHTCHKKGS